MTGWQAMSGFPLPLTGIRKCTSQSKAGQVLTAPALAPGNDLNRITLVSP